MEWKVKFVDYPAQFKKMEREIMNTVRNVLSQGDLMLRQQLRDFESHLASYVGVQYAVGTSNCTDALHLSLRAAGIGAGDEVITISHTFVATVAAVHHAGATPVLVDIGDDHNMNVDLVEPAITAKTKALVPVHLNGRLCKMDRLMEIAERHGLIVIEDSAQALGASFNGRRGGAWGLAGCFSFYPAKLLGAYGDAGAMTTNSLEIAETVRALRDHGRTGSGEISGWSFNCRLDNLQAALLDCKLQRLTELITRRRELASAYNERLSSVKQIRLPPHPTTTGPSYDVFQNYEIEAKDRDYLLTFLKQHGVEILIPWGGRGIHQFKSLGLSHFSLPRTDRFFNEAMMLPLHPELCDDQVQYVCDLIHEYYNW